MEIVATLLEEKFAGKKKLSESNTRALRLGYDYARDHFDCPLPFHLEKMDANSDKILIDGNTAIALGCVYAGATVAAWYPITPSTSAMDAFKVFCEKYRKDPETGKNNYIIIQAEDELAAIGMVIGAAWNGARAFTSTAGPGISLMNELLGLAYYAEDPRRDHRCRTRWARPPACLRAPSRAICSNAPTRRTATRNIFCCFRRIRPSASNSRRSLSIWPSASRRRSF